MELIFVEAEDSIESSSFRKVSNQAKINNVIAHSRAVFYCSKI